MTRLSTFLACALALPACATSNTDPNAQASTVQGTKLRRPVGNYAHISLHNVVAPNPDLDWTSYLDCLYDDMLANPGMSGLQLGIQWGDVSTSSTGPNDWRYVSAAFDRVAAWNAQPNVPQKSIQLIINPGFESPSWLLSSIPSCDGLFSGTGKAAKNCGTITIQGFAEPSSSNVLPLPWNPVYIAAWNALLADVQANFGANPNQIGRAHV